jgi:hypothetical protein
MWSTLAANFRADPTRTDDPVVNFLLGFAGPERTVLDVGGGAGRYALPLALRSKSVTVVEPSPSMTSALSDAEGPGSTTSPCSRGWRMPKWIPPMSSSAPTWFTASPTSSRSC